MKKILFICAALISLTGCNNPTPKPVYVNHYVKTKCPKFNTKISIDVKAYNDNYALISWEDVSKIEHLLKKKKEFNKSIDKLNKD